MLTSEIRIDVNNHTAPDIYARIGESNTRRVKFYPGYYDTDGNFVGLSTEEESIRVEFRMVKPDNTFVVVDLPISIVDDPITFRVMLTPEMCQVGDSEDADEFLYTAHGRFIIDDNMLTDEMIESVAAANGYVFPDDFVTQEQLTDYATKEYVDDSISHVDTKHTYSTEEQVIGTWVDGSTVYEKTVNFGSLPNNTTKQVAHGIANVNKIWIFDGFVTSGTTQYQLDHAAYGIYCWTINVDSTNIEIETESDRSALSAYVTLRYTKTT